MRFEIHCDKGAVDFLEKESMRVYTKKQIIDMKNTIEKFFVIIGRNIRQKRFDMAFEMLIELQQAFIEVGGIIENEAGADTSAVKYLEHACEMLYLCTEAFGKSQCEQYLDSAKTDYNRCLEIVLNNIPSELIKIVFMPYKSSMWTSMESIWKAAQSDNNCDVKVVPIPYSILDETKSVEVYEIEQFPEYVSVINHNDYHLEKEKPDIIIIHNPYDETNTMTRVPEKYFSNNLRLYTNCLVYSPYHTIGGFIKGTTENFIAPKATLYADKIIVQSEYVKQIYLSYGFNSDKILAYGSPKVDSIIQMNDNWSMPKEWEEKFAGKKKIILLNTHWAYFIKGKQYEKKGKRDFAVRFHEEFFKAVEENDDSIGFIWRPHPLMFEATNQRSEECLPYINDFVSRIEKSKFAVIDRNDDYRYAFAASDALVSTYSSLINEYLVTGKPVMIFQSKLADEIEDVSPIDHRTCYFRFPKDGGMTFSEYFQMLLDGSDEKYNERMEMLKNRSFANLDGTAGAKIHNHLIREMGVII